MHVAKLEPPAWAVSRKKSPLLKKDEWWAFQWSDSEISERTMI